MERNLKQGGTATLILCLISTIVSGLSVATALILYLTRDTIIEVPERPQPGFYSVKQLPDTQFINAASSVVNLVATYQPTVARRQFKTARKYLWEPALTQFEGNMMGAELRTIEDDKRSQMFFIDPKQIKVERSQESDVVVVKLAGVRQQLLGSKPLPADDIAYYVKMTTIPRNVHNEFGIVVIDLKVEENGKTE